MCGYSSAFWLLSLRGQLGDHTLEERLAWARQKGPGLTGVQDCTPVLGSPGPGVCSRHLWEMDKRQVGCRRCWQGSLGGLQTQMSLPLAPATPQTHGPLPSAGADCVCRVAARRSPAVALSTAAGHAPTRISKQPPALSWDARWLRGDWGSFVI